MMRSYAKILPHQLVRPAGSAQPWALPDLCRGYGLPTGLPGGGVIGIIELGGAYAQSDLDDFFTGIGLPVPVVTNVSVSGGGQISSGADAEVALDQQVAGGVYAYCTGKPAQIRMYWLPNTGAAIGQGIQAAAADGCDVFSISWGEAETFWGLPNALRLEQISTAAVIKGMAITAASGDNDADDGSGGLGVDLPAACPFILACGGTMRPRHRNWKRNPETVWNNNPGIANGEGTGGGYSKFFPMPSWQVGVAPAGAGRMVSDVAAVADPNTGYHIILHGQNVVVGGTSAVAPLYAGLLAACGKKLGAVGQKLWANPGAFGPITVGENGGFPGPVCCGLGVPRGSTFTDLFK
jgi:subtilase family serine protease